MISEINKHDCDNHRIHYLLLNYNMNVIISDQSIYQGIYNLCVYMITLSNFALT